MNYCELKKEIDKLLNNTEFSDDELIKFVDSFESSSKAYGDVINSVLSTGNIDLIKTMDKAFFTDSHNYLFDEEELYSKNFGGSIKSQIERGENYFKNDNLNTKFQKLLNKSTLSENEKKEVKEKYYSSIKYLSETLLSIGVYVEKNEEGI